MYKEGRVISPDYAAWRALQFSLVRISMPCEVLPIHLIGEQHVSIDVSIVCEYSGVYNAMQPSKSLSSQVDDLEMRTMLTAFYELCSNDEWARGLKYIDVNSYFTWRGKDKKWVARKVNRVKLVMQQPLDEDYDETNNECTLARLQTVPATDAER